MRDARRMDFRQQKPESIQENLTHKSFWDFDIQTDHLIWTRLIDLVLIKKKTRNCHQEDFAIPAGHMVKRATSTRILSESL